MESVVNIAIQKWKRKRKAGKELLVLQQSERRGGRAAPLMISFPDQRRGEANPKLLLTLKNVQNRKRLLSFFLMRERREAGNRENHQTHITRSTRTSKRGSKFAVKLDCSPLFALFSLLYLSPPVPSSVPPHERAKRR